MNLKDRDVVDDFSLMMSQTESRFQSAGLSAYQNFAQLCTKTLCRTGSFFSFESEYKYIFISMYIHIFI